MPPEETRLKNSGLYRIVRYRYIGVNQTFHEQHNIIQGRMKTIILVKVQITVKEAGQVIQFFT